MRKDNNKIIQYISNLKPNKGNQGITIARLCGIVLSASLLAPLTSCAYSNQKQNQGQNIVYNNKHIKASRLSNALARLGLDDVTVKKYNAKTLSYQSVTLKARDRQVAFIENLHLSNAFKPSVIQRGIIRMQGSFGPYKKSSRDALKHIDAILKYSNAYSNDYSNLKTSYILDKLFQSRVFDDQDVEDIILYLSQVSFTEIANQSDQAVNIGNATKNQKRYIENAARMGLIDPILTKQAADVLLVLGCARPSYISRVSFLLQNYCNEDCSPLHKLYPSIRISSGWRTLYAEIDGIQHSPQNKEEEGMSYIAKLARKYTIKPKTEDLFVTEECGNRKLTRFNDNGEVRESLMASDTYATIIGDQQYDLYDTKAPKGKSRPNTRDCAINDIQEIISQNKNKKHIVIAVLSNQPYILRQVQSVKISANQVLTKLNDKKTSLEFVPIGPGINWKGGAEVNINAIKREVGGMIFESHTLIESKYNKCKRKRSSSDIVSIAHYKK